jgi:hypothetical protein
LVSTKVAILGEGFGLNRIVRESRGDVEEGKMDADRFPHNNWTIERFDSSHYDHGLDGE